MQRVLRPYSLAVAATLLQVAGALAGCLGAEPTSIASTTVLIGEDGGEETPQPAASGLDAPSGPPANPPIDPWGDATERVLFDEAVEGGQCYFLATFYEAANQHPEVMTGCATLPPENAGLVPEGTGALRLDVDATGATTADAYHAVLETRERDTPEESNGASTSEKRHTWTFPVTPREWDPPLAQATSSTISLWPDSPVGLNGPIQMRLVAQRDPAWAPRAPVDEWARPDRHRIVQPGVISLRDPNATWELPGLVERILEPAPHVAAPLSDVIPQGTTSFVVGVRGPPLEDCPAAFDCKIRVYVESGGLSSRMVAAEGPDWTIYEYDVPDEVVPDSIYVNNTTTRLDVWFEECLATPDWCLFYGPAYFWTIQTRQEDVRVLAEAWRGSVDLAAVKARLGVA